MRAPPIAPAPFPALSHGCPDNINEQLQVPPPNKQVRDSAIYWQLHFVTSRGLGLPSGVQIRHWRYLHMAWLAVLAMYDKVGKQRLRIWL